jgi:hypothetical protein
MDLAHGLETSYKDFLEWFKNHKIVENLVGYIEVVGTPEDTLYRERQ